MKDKKQYYLPLGFIIITVIIGGIIYAAQGVTYSALLIPLMGAGGALGLIMGDKFEKRRKH